MDNAIQLYSFLVITFVGFIAPILGFLLMILKEGVEILTVQSENERVKSENNIKLQLEKQKESKEIDSAAIQKSLNQLKLIKKEAEAKLSLLNPKIQIPRLFIFLAVSFLGAMGFFVTYSYYKIMVLLISIGCFGYAIYMLWKLFDIVVESKMAINEIKEDSNTSIIELLSKLVEETQKGALAFLRNVFINFDNIVIKDDAIKYGLKVNDKSTIRISITNREKRMAKKIEIGLVFSLNFIIEKQSGQNLYIGQNQQILRYKVDFIQGDTKQLLSPLVITPLKKGEYQSTFFIKAENVEVVDRKVMFSIE